MLNFEQIKELIELVGRHGLSGVELERSGFRLKVDGQASAPVLVTEGAPIASRPVASPPPPSAAPSPAAAEEAPASAAPAVHDGAHTLTSPIVGTFYRASNPDASPFVEVGGRVKKGDVVCIVEAMKLMNEIEADIDGVIVEIYPENAQPVEFGEKLFAIQPS